ncbi:MAG: YlxR family protein [Deltaproteobacteria bacterium]|nr:YlxR family protein [Deltaproteobacteria bacterium]
MARGRRAARTRAVVPQRTCIACRAVKGQAELVRITAAGGVAVVDAGRQLGGRGCWLCRSEACAKAAFKGQKIARALKGKGREPSLQELLSWVGAVATVPSLDARGHGG